jgi:hypothetical protein
MQIFPYYFFIDDESGNWQDCLGINKTGQRKLPELPGKLPALRMMNESGLC